MRVASKMRVGLQVNRCSRFGNRRN